ncbi:M14 family zinc carboxypeptidase [Leucobacter albus]|uniref:M14 family zinc carboxypeptidase n=1 Tax=Leucobacter albus TaxID=272210 RepID=A0ABW3TNJ9_9MICO
MAAKSRPLAMYIAAGVLLSGVFTAPAVALADEQGADAPGVSEAAELVTPGTNQEAGGDPDGPTAGTEAAEPEAAPAEGEATDAPAAPEAALEAPAAEQLRTGFEIRGEVEGESWTTAEEELDFLTTLAATSPRVEVDVLGKSTLGRDLHLVRVGADKPAPRAELSEANTAMVTCTQHGNEEAPREACLKLVRDLAFSEDPAIVEYLKAVTVVVIPTGNPDGFFAAGPDGVVTHDTRTRLLWDGVDAQGNPAPGTDPNRDHLALKTVEGRLMSSLLSEFTPHVALDAHEIPVRGVAGPKPGPNSNPKARYGDAEFLYPRNANVPEDVWKLSKDFVDGAIAGTREAGFDGRYYLSGGDERIMRNVLGLRGTVSVLLESNQNNLNNKDRVRVQTTAMEDVLGYHAENVERVTGMAKKYEASQIQAGKDRAPLFVGGVVPDGNPTDGVGTLPGGDPLATLDPAPACYTLTAADYETVRDQLKGHNVVVDKVGEGYQIDLAQKARPMIPYIVDAAAQYAEVAATPSAECADVDPGTGGPGTGGPGTGEPGTDGPGTGGPGTGGGKGDGSTAPVTDSGKGSGNLAVSGSEGLWLPVGAASLLLAAGVWALARTRGKRADA